jgi:hypothetical protein
MIGGKDFIIATMAGSRALELAARTMLARWPQAVFEDAQTGKRFASLSAIPFGTCSELLVYKNAKAAKQWEQLGADQSVADTMIHLLTSNKSLTIVVDDEPSMAIKSLVAEIEDAVGRKPRKAI